ncbi:MAG: nucleotidyltransferase domain-containing protein [Bdellovibrionota bacterium]
MSFSETLLRTNNPTQPSEYFEYIKILVNDLARVTPDFKAYVFGSVANKTSTEDSDLDILFLFPNVADIKEIRRKFFATKTKLHFETDLVFQTEAQFKHPQSLFDQAVSETMIEVYPNWKF